MTAPDYRARAEELSEKIRQGVVFTCFLSRQEIRTDIHALCQQARAEMGEEIARECEGRIRRQRDAERHESVVHANKVLQSVADEARRLSMPPPEPDEFDRFAHEWMRATENRERTGESVSQLARLAREFFGRKP